MAKSDNWLRHIYLSVRPKAQNSAATGRSFTKFGIFRVSVEKVQVPLKSDKNKQVLYYSKVVVYFLQAMSDMAQMTIQYGACVLYAG